MSMNIENQICEHRANTGETVVEQRGNNEGTTSRSLARSRQERRNKRT